MMATSLSVHFLISTKETMKMYIELYTFTTYFTILMIDVLTSFLVDLASETRSVNGDFSLLFLEACHRLMVRMVYCFCSFKLCACVRFSSHQLFMDAMFSQYLLIWLCQLQLEGIFVLFSTLFLCVY